jgi:hypothetical protein
MSSLAKTSPPEYLVRYTGWFEDQAGERIVITRDAGKLHIGHLTGTPSAISKSVAIRIDGFRPVHKPGTTAEEKALGPSIQTVALTIGTPHNNTVIFKVTKGEIKGLRYDKKDYERVSPPENARFLDVPPEVRERIWRYALENTGRANNLLALTEVVRGDCMITDNNTPKVFRRRNLFSTVKNANRSPLEALESYTMHPLHFPQGRLPG